MYPARHFRAKSSWSMKNSRASGLVWILCRSVDTTAIFVFWGSGAAAAAADITAVLLPPFSPDGICPQVKCADEKGLEGCWLCTELDGCAKGYYGNQDEYVAKATAMFIRKHGKETYTEALRRAVEAGENYPKSFDAQGSVEAALRLLEQYR